MEASLSLSEEVVSSSYFINLPTRNLVKESYYLCSYAISFILVTIFQEVEECRGPDENIKV